MLSSADVVDEVFERLSNVPSHTVVSLHVIVKEVLAVLVERGFLAYDEPAMTLLNSGEPACELVTAKVEL
jgi:hypothetical protein